MGLDHRCDAGHFYDPSQHTSCPDCGVQGLQAGTTMPKRQTAQAPADSSEPTIPAGGVAGHGGSRGGTVAPRRNPGVGDGKTIGVFQKKMGVNPVVGWLVCIHGPDRGRDYRIRSGRNFIGRDERMDIWIKGDDTISREKHAVVSYDPKNGRFKLLPGDSVGLTYVNDETVDVPVELKPFDTIELGETKLKFVPFCGEKFRWSTEPQAAGA